MRWRSPFFLGSLGMLLLASAARLASAAPVATLREDLDGDGAADPVELSADGVVTISGARTKATIKIAPSATRGRLGVAHVSGRTQILVEVVRGATREGVILGGSGGAWRELARTPLGDVGLDADYAVEIDATPRGIVRYQRRAGYQRCDATPGYLFGEGFTGTKFQRLSKLPTGVADSAPSLPAVRETQPSPAPVLVQARAASTQPGASDAGGLGLPRELDDGKNDTVWREELAGSAGEGQYFTFEPRVAGAKVRALRIVPGNPTSATTSKQFNRPRRFAIVAGTEAWRVELPDAAADALGTAYTVELPHAVDGCATVVLEDTYGPDKGQTAIAELEVFADGEREGGAEPLLAHVIAAGADGVTSAGQLLARRGAAGVAAIDAELAKTTDARARRRLVQALVKIADPATGPLLARAAVEGWVAEQDLIDVIGALARNGQLQELHDLAATGGVAHEARVAAARGLPPSGAGLPLLVDLAGRGPRELRAAVIDQLAGAPAGTLAEAATAQHGAAASGDLWRAVTKRLRAAVDERAVATSAMAAALPAAADYERRYRLIDGLATYGDATALHAIETLLASLPPGGETSALRQVAIRAVGIAPRAESIGLVTGAARDPDPGVRLAVLGVLETADVDPATAWHTSTGPDGIDRVIVTALSTDTWPEVRRRAATALGARCQRTGPAAALADAVGRDASLEVRSDALSALVQCKAPGAAELLSRTWDNGKLPVTLRAHAVDLAVALEDPRLGVRLVERFGAWRGAALESADAVTLAQSAAASIGRMRAPGAAQVLIAALDDAAFPEIVSAAALGLGALGPACPAAAQTKLRALARAGEQPSTAAGIAAKQCGR